MSATELRGLPAIYRGFEPDERREPKVGDLIEVHTFQPMLCVVTEVNPDGLGGVAVQPFNDPVMAIWEGRWSQFPY